MPGGGFIFTMLNDWLRQRALPPNARISGTFPAKCRS
jgi:hypothetical protein